MAITVTVTELERRRTLHCLMVGRNEAIKLVSGEPTENLVREHWDRLIDKFKLDD